MSEVVASDDGFPMDGEISMRGCAPPMGAIVTHGHTGPTMRDKRGGMRTGGRYALIVAGLVGFVLVSSVGAGSCQGTARQEVGDAVCLQCHNGLDASDKRTFAQSAHNFFDCEECHGPGYTHVRNGGRGGLLIGNPASLPFDKRSDMCATCHAQQTAEYKLSGHFALGAASCHDCHDIHKPGGNRLSPIDNSQCMQCHTFLGFATDADVQAHTKHPVDPAGSGASRCTPCHLPPLQRLDQDAGPHDHTLFTIPPIASNEAAEAGVTPVPPNSCAGITGCHDGADPTIPVFDVDNPAVNNLLQNAYNTWFQN